MKLWFNFSDMSIKGIYAGKVSLRKFKGMEIRFDSKNAVAQAEHLAISPN